MCVLERLVTEHSLGMGIFREPSLGEARSCMCWPCGILARIFSEQIRVESRAGSQCGVTFLPLSPQYVFTIRVST